MSSIRSVGPALARFALGGLFLLFGLNGFFQFLPPPAEPPPPGAMAFVGALVQTGYMLPLIKGTEVLAGLLLLSGRYVPLALTLLAPIVVNIVAFHVVLAPGVGPLLIAFTTLGLGIYLAFAERAVFRPFFRATRDEAASSVRAPGAGVHAVS
jgi:uncharacterized membrane protein YphA (DoxX/SURF4 family)